MSSDDNVDVSPIVPDGVNTVVVVRQYLRSRPCVSLVRRIEATDGCDDTDFARRSLLEYLAKQHIEEFRGRFIEFKNAMFYIEFFKTE